jgi:hypothetical protein
MITTKLLYAILPRWVNNCIFTGNFCKKSGIYCNDRVFVPSGCEKKPRSACFSRATRFACTCSPASAAGDGGYVGHVNDALVDDVRRLPQKVSDIYRRLTS